MNRKLLRPTVRRVQRFFSVLLPPFLCRAFRRRKRTKFPSSRLSFRPRFVEASGAHLFSSFFFSFFLFFFSATVLIPRNHFSCSRCCLWKNRGGKRGRGSSNNMVKSFKRVPATWNGWPRTWSTHYKATYFPLFPPSFSPLFSLLFFSFFFSRLLARFVSSNGNPVAIIVKSRNKPCFCWSMLHCRQGWMWRVLREFGENEPLLVLLARG